MHKKNLNTEWLYLLLGLTAYLFCIQLSKDWVHYHWWWGLLERKTWLTVLQELSILREPFYNLPVKAFSPYIGFPTVIFIATVSLTWLKLHTLRKIVADTYAATFFYICIYWLLLEGTQLRVAYATTFIILGFYFLQNQRYWLSLLMIAIASQIHFTAIFFSLVFIFYFVQPVFSLVLAIFLISPAVVIFDVSTYAWLEQLIMLINPRYLLYGSQKIHGQNSTGLYIYFIAFFWTLLLLIEWQLRSFLTADRFTLALQRLAMSGVIVMCIFHDHVALGARLGELLLLPIVILLSLIYIEWNKVNNQIGIYALTAIFLGYFIARLIYLYPGVMHIFHI